MKCKKDLFAVPLAPNSKDTSDGGQLHIASQLAITIKQPELRTGILFIARKQLSVDDANALQHGIVLGDDLLPISSRGGGGIGYESPVSRRIFISRYKYLAVENLSAIQKVLAFSNPNRG